MGKQNIRGKEAYCETFLVKMSFIKLHEVKESVFLSKASRLTSLWNRGSGQLEHVVVVFNRDLQIRGQGGLRERDWT